jgi:hypothetical protein
MIQNVEESGVITLGTKTSSVDFATSPVGEALTAKTKKKRVVKKDTNDMVMAINVQVLRVRKVGMEYWFHCFNKL